MSKNYECECGADSWVIKNTMVVFAEPMYKRIIYRCTECGKERLIEKTMDGFLPNPKTWKQVRKDFGLNNYYE